MYVQHYQLAKKPFDISPDPDFLWLGEKHEEGLATLKYGILQNKGYLMITGDVGTGKTALIRAIEQEIRGEIIVAIIPDPSMTAIDFFNYLACELGIAPAVASKGAFLIEFKRFLRGAAASGKRVLLIVDEAQRLTSELLEEIRLLSNIDVNGHVAINTFFVGQLEFTHLLRRDENRAVRQRITVSYELTPLTAGETSEYIAHRLKVAGAAGPIFTAEAIHLIHGASRGYPRLINIICDHALMSGYAQVVSTIGEEIIRDCARELEVPIGSIGCQETTAPVARIAPSLPKAIALAPAAGKRPARSRGLRVAAALALVLGLGFFMGKNPLDPPSLLAKALTALVPEAKFSLGSQGHPQVAAPEENSRGEEERTGGETPQEAAPPMETTTAAIPAIGPASAPPGAVPLQTANLSPPSSPVIAPASLKVDEFLQPPEFAIFFTRNSAEIPIYAHEILSAAVSLLGSAPASRAVIEGHADATGDSALNMALSAERAAAVKEYLLAQGIAADRLTVSMYGAARPAESNATPEGRGKNRRVIVRVVQTG